MKASLILFSCLLLPSIASATDYLPPDVRTHLAEYSGKYKIILNAAKDPSIPIEERLVRFQVQLTDLRAKFGTARTKEYLSRSTSLSVSHSCTKGSSGGKKDCGWKCVNSPSTDLYTTPEWVAVSGDDKGRSVSESQACLRMTRAGKGRNAGTLTARFQYKPIAVELLVKRDTDLLFQLIVENSEAAGRKLVEASESNDFVDQRSGTPAIEFEGQPDKPEASAGNVK